MLRRAFSIQAHLTLSSLVLTDEETDCWANVRCSCTSDDSKLDRSSVFAVTEDGEGIAVTVNQCKSCVPSGTHA